MQHGVGFGCNAMFYIAFQFVMWWYRDNVDYIVENPVSSP